ncbi:cupin domain-containing protein [Larkinella insperata]|uniref:Cupin domain-containing protein n=1 Tax=Larkinella insperata TaxID=332158 RepID=A0ABW3Q5D9_9BACT
MNTPVERYLFADDGVIPNSPLPVVLYRRVWAGADLSSWLENRFKTHHWTNNWRDIILPYDHFHSTTHEVLGVGKGRVKLHIGGQKGETLTVSEGDVLIIPAGVGHFALPQDDPYEIVGGYPDGRSWDLLRGSAEERMDALSRIAQLPLPQTDPIFGADGPLRSVWHSV